MRVGAAFAVAVAATTVAGCLSGGPPPAGQRLSKGRDIVDVSFRDLKPGAPLLLWQRLDAAALTPQGFDLHLITTSPGDPSIQDRLLAHGVVVQALPRPDTRGRLAIGILEPGSAPSSFAPDLVMVDTNTGQQLDLGSASLYAYSPSNDRLVYQTQAGLMRVHEIDDRDLALDSDGQFAIGTFLGEDFYYSVGPALSTNPASVVDLWRITPGGEPEHLASGLSSFSITGPFVALTRPGPTGDARPLSVLDLATGQESVVPGATNVLSASPDGRWLVATSNPIGGGATTFTFFAPATGATQSFDLPIQYVPPVQWRPGAGDELWFWTGTFTTIATPGALPVEIPNGLYEASNPDGTRRSFTSDGANFFSFASTASSDSPNASPVYLVPVDAPGSPGVPLNARGSILLSVSELPGARLLVGVAYKDYDRADFFLIDRATGASRLLAEAGALVAVGERRLLATLNRIDGAGDLTLVDFDTGASTTLAESVVSVAVEGSAGTDALAPGTRVVYVLRNSIASPYDGAWLVTLP